MPDHIHIFIDVPQTVAPYAMWLELLKVSALSNYLKRICNLKSSMAGCGTLWPGGYFVSTVERISEAAVIKYIEEQKDDKSRRIQKGSKTIS